MEGTMATTTGSSVAVDVTKESEELDLDPRERDLDALAIVRRNSLWAMGVGLVPLPLVAVLGISAVQLKMVRELTLRYGIPFSHHKAKNIVGALLGGIGSVTAAGLAFSLLKFIPVVGMSASAVAMPLT